MKRRDCNEVFNVEASEIRVLLPSLCQKVKIDKTGVSVFLSLCYSRPPRKKKLERAAPYLFCFRGVCAINWTAEKFITSGPFALRRFNFKLLPLAV